jgi:hypothetical protein
MVIAIILQLPDVSRTLLVAVAVLPVYYTVLSFILHARRQVPPDGQAIAAAVVARPLARPPGGGAVRALVVVTIVGLTWTMRQGWAVYKLRHGVGDTWFLAASGERWFRMNESPTGRPARRDPEAPPGRIRRRRGPPLLSPSRCRSDRARAGGRAQPAAPGTVEGGSTLTQQLARTLFLSNRKTYGRKIQEAVLALLIDGAFTKDQVLELYLNRIYLSAGIYGVETMSQSLFGGRRSR